MVESLNLLGSLVQSLPRPIDLLVAHMNVGLKLSNMLLELVDNLLKPRYLVLQLNDLILPLSNLLYQCYYLRVVADSGRSRR